MIRGGQTRTGGIDEARIIWAGLERAFRDVQREGTGIAVLERGLSKTKEEDENEEEGVTGLLELAKDGKEGLDGVAPSAWFWRECASGMDKRFRDACRCIISFLIVTDFSFTVFGEDFEEWVFEAAGIGEGGCGGE